MSDYEHIVISAVRYAIGRMTYMVELTVNYVIKEIDANNLSKKCLEIILKDIRKAKDLGMDCDIREWHKLIDKIRSVV